MPLTPSYTWQETESSVAIEVSLPRAKAEQVDVLATQYFIKINFPPYLLNLDLHDAINCEDVTNTARIGDNKAVLEFKKATPAIWGTLVSKLGKDELKRRRDQSIQAHEERLSAAREVMKSKKIQDDRHALQEQMRLEQEQRELLERKKEEEKLRAQQDIFALTTKAFADEVDDLPATTEASDDEVDDLPVVAPIAPTPLPADDVKPPHILKPTSDIFDATTDVQEPTVPVIPVKTSVVKMSFTAKKFPNMAARETQEAEPPVPKTKEAPKALTAEGEEDVETNALWLKEKGDQFYKHKDFKAAVNAYTAALQRDPLHLSALSNRSACYLQLLQYPDCIEDCTTVLSRIQANEPLPTGQQVKWESVTLARRAAAYCGLGSMEKARMDLERALSLDSSNEKLREDLASVTRACLAIDEQTCAPSS
eukprot:GILK01007162.1.p1 GENE.GILK01007162.1~~GILK01007162.1.p1  ORF type:complete len:424 (+),score=64.46 GILK01007162.1:47-1318(+)